MTKTDWTVEEVRSIAASERGSNDKYADIRIDMLTAFADRIEADESAVPVAWVDPDDVAEKRKAIMGTADPYEHEGTRYKLPLFTHPPAQAAQIEPSDGMQDSRPKPRMPIGLLGQEDFCYCNNEVSLQSVSGGGASEGYLGSVRIKVGGEFVRYVLADKGTGYDISNGVLEALRSVWPSRTPQASRDNAVSAEDRFEHYVQSAIDNAPDPLRRLGEYLTRVLDEDQWPTAERLLLALALRPVRSGVVSDEDVEAAQPAQEQPARSGRCEWCPIGKLGGIAEQVIQEQPGWKLVPIEPDQWMRTQGEEGFEQRSVLEIWRRMLAAAPTPPKEK